MKVSVTIMAHPARKHWIPYLKEKLDAPAEVVWDEKNDRWDTGRRSLLAADPTSDYHLVVQDDALLCEDLVAGVTKALDHVPPGHPLGLYIGKVRPMVHKVMPRVDLARSRGDRWIVMDGPWWGVGLAVPTGDVRDIVRWGDGRRNIANYDKRISKFYYHRRKPCYYPMPSLVEHRHGPDNPSLVPGRTSLVRCAAWFIGEDVSALSLDWGGNGQVHPKPALRAPGRRL